MSSFLKTEQLLIFLNLDVVTHTQKKSNRNLNQANNLLYKDSTCVSFSIDTAVQYPNEVN